MDGVQLPQGLSHFEEAVYFLPLSSQKFLVLNKRGKRNFTKKNLVKEENIGKPKELWKALKTLGFPCKKGSISNVCLKKDDKISFDNKPNANTFKEFFCNFASDLVAKLPPPSNEFGITSVCNYYRNIFNLLPNKFNFSSVTEDFVLKLLKDMNIDKAAGTDNLSGKFLKDGANILAKPISKICHLSIKYSVFPKDCQVAKLKPLYKRVPQNFLEIIGQF